MPFPEKKLVLLSADLAGYARWSGRLPAAEVAEFLNAWYRLCAGVIRPAGGRIVKFMGDGCFAVFPETGSVAAVEAATRLRADLGSLPAPAGAAAMDLSAKVHLAVVAEGAFGPADDARYDVIGSGVNHLFLMGGAPGIRISEPVFRQLPNEARGRWRRHEPPATYELERGA